MPFAVGIGPTFVHRAKERVAGAQADGDLAGLDETEADDAGRIVPGPDGGERFGIETEFPDKISADLADDLSGGGERWQFAL